MAAPINSRTTTQKVLGGLASTIKMGGNGICAAAKPLQTFGKWTWNKVGGSGSQAETYWNTYAPETKSTIKKMAAIGAGLGAVALSGPVALAYTPVVTGTIALAGTTAYKWLNNSTIGNSLAGGAAAGAAAAYATALIPIAPVLTVGYGLIPGIATAATVLVAANPNTSVGFKLPKAPLIRWDTPDDSEPLPEVPSLALEKLSEKIVNFRAKHPVGGDWVNPHDEMIKDLSANEEAFKQILTGLKALGLTTPEQTRVNVVKEVILDLIPDVNEADINISLVERIEAMPALSDVYKAAKIETDKQVDLLVKNSSLFTTLLFIHTNRLGFEQTDAVNLAYREILKEKIESPDESLWGLYMKHLGGDLSFFQKIRAGFWYFLTYTIGVIPNTVESFVKNVIGEFRKAVESSNPTQLNTVFKTTIEQLTILLQLYEDSATQYVEGANNPDRVGWKLTQYQKMAIDKLGDPLLFDKINAEQKPGEDIGKKMMTELCKGLTLNLVDQCFPQVQFFENLKKTTLFGIRIGIVFDFVEWLIGGIINFFAREMTKYYLPANVQSLIELGLDKTLPGQYSFKIAIANSLEQQVNEFKEELKTLPATKPARLVQSSEIEGLADRIMTTLKLKLLGEEPERAKVRQFLNDRSPGRTIPEEEEELRIILIEGVQQFIYHYSKKPEKMEKLFGNLLEQSNKGFKVDRTVHTAVHYKKAFDGLITATEQLLEEAVEEGVKKEFKHIDQKTIKEFMEGVKDNNGRIVNEGIYDIQQKKGKYSFETLSSICAQMTARLEARNPDEGTLLLQELDHYVEILNEFGTHSKSMDIDLYPDAVQHGFYKTFHPIYQNSIALAEQAIAIQQPQIQYDKQMKLFHRLDEINQLVEHNAPTPKTLRDKLDAIEKIGSSYDTEVPGLAQKLTILREHITGIEAATYDAEEENDLIAHLGDLGDPARFTHNLLADPKVWNEKIRNKVSPEDQEPLFAHIRVLQAAIRVAPRPHLTPIRTEIENELRNILQKHIDRKNEKIELMNQSLTAFKTGITTTLEESIASRDELFDEIKDHFQSLADNTNRLLEQLKRTSMPKLKIVHLPEVAVALGQYFFGNPLVAKIKPYLKVAFKLITNNDTYQGASRLFMGTINKQYPKKESGVASSLFQWVAKKVLPPPVEKPN